MDDAIFTDITTNFNSDYAASIDVNTCLRNLIDDQFLGTNRFFKWVFLMFLVTYVIPVMCNFLNPTLIDNVNEWGQYLINEGIK